jgi:predicted transcriptional regulator
VAPKLEKKFPGYISLRIEDELQRKLEELAEAEDRSVGYIARALIREGLAAREGKKPKKKAP